MRIWTQRLLVTVEVSTYVLLDRPPLRGLVRNNALDAPSSALPHLLFAVDGPGAKVLASRLAFHSELASLGRSQDLVHDREAMAVVEEVLANLGDGHGDGEAGEVGQDL